MWNLIGNERAVGELQRAVAADSLPHALLFTGPAGVGKTHLALELARTLNCTGEDPPCRVCPSCHLVEIESHPDVVVMEPADGKDTIAIQQVRQLREGASLRAFQGRKKVYVIAGAETLTAQAADALLKTLEEPQPQVQLVLTAVEAERLPATVVSRCRVVSLQAVGANAIETALASRGQSAETARKLARLAQGNVGWALRAAEQPKLAAQQEEMVARLSGLFDLDPAARLQLAEDLAGDRKDRSSVRRVLELLLLLGRDLLRLSQGMPGELMAPDEEERLQRQAQRLGLERIGRYMEGVRVAMARVDQNVDARLTLEALFTSLP